MLMLFHHLTPDLLPSRGSSLFSTYSILYIPHSFILSCRIFSLSFRKFLLYQDFHLKTENFFCSPTIGSLCGWLFHRVLADSSPNAKSIIFFPSGWKLERLGGLLYDVDSAKNYCSVANTTRIQKYVFGLLYSVKVLFAALLHCIVY